MMCELPTNALLADEYLEYFDGMSIGSNDMTQLTLGLDRDSAIVARLFDERDPAVRKLLAMAISACRKHGKYIGICGQGPSDHPDLARWLVDQGIDSMSLNPDTVVETWLFLAQPATGAATQLGRAAPGAPRARRCRPGRTGARGSAAARGSTRRCPPWPGAHPSWRSPSETSGAQRRASSLSVLTSRLR